MFSRAFVAFAATAAAFNTEDVEESVRKSLLGKSFDLGKSSGIPDPLDLQRRTQLSMTRVCVVSNEVGCLVEMGCMVAIKGFEGISTTGLQVDDLEMGKSDKCTLANADICRQLDLTMSANVQKLVSVTTGSLYLDAFGLPTLTMEGNLNIRFKDIKASTKASLQASAVVGSACQGEMPLLTARPTFDNFGYEGVDFDFNFNDWFNFNVDLHRYVSEEQLREAFETMFTEGAALRQQAEFETQNLLGNLWRRIIESVSGRVKFPVTEPADICQA